MGKNRRNQRSKRNSKVSVRSAPTMQGMQQVNSWDLIDIVPIVLGPSGQPDVPSFIQFQAGTNGWGYAVYNLGSDTPVSAQAALYGELGNQFQELQALWSTYRLNHLTMQFTPVQAGAGFQSPVVSVVDPAGAQEVIQTSPVGPQTLIDISRLKTVNVHGSFTKCTRKFNYSQWITQTCPQPFLQTVDPDGSGGERVLYPTQSAQTAPLIRYVWQVATTFPGAIVGVMHVRANITVRGRRGVQLGALELLTREQQLNVFMTLRQQFEEKKDDTCASEENTVANVAHCIRATRPRGL